MSDRPCRLSGCDRDRRPSDEVRDRFAAAFCSTEHELKHEHLVADAKDAARSVQYDQPERRQRGP